MFLSTETTSILKNFSSINQSILIKQGKRLRRMSVMKNVLAESDIIEQFDRDVAIYDLSQFLNCLSLIPGAELKLMDDYINEARRLGVKIFYDIDDPIFNQEVYIQMLTFIQV